MSKLDLSAFKKALTSLSNSLNVAEHYVDNDSHNIEQVLEDTIRAGVIQNFEFTYELCWKFIKRWLENNYGSTTVDGTTRRELFRLAAENKLIDSIDEWMFFHRMRNLTSHTYDFDTAEEIYNSTRKFYECAKKLFDNIAARND